MPRDPIVPPATEQLVGGPCDGLQIPATESSVMYAGRWGAGQANVYLRDENGRLRFRGWMAKPDFSIVYVQPPE